MDFNPTKSFEDIQKFNQQNIDTTVKLMGEWSKGWQAIAAEMTDYTKRSFEDGTATLEKLMAAKSVEQAFEIQSSYAKRSYDEYMQQMTKVGGMYASIAKEAGKPVERMFQFGR
ncbi:MAG: phasin family protein [Hyphomicrobiaceae bacterium]|nr:phasin family protein [Hyphomicrobiaceae bacterium]